MQGAGGVFAQVDQGRRLGDGRERVGRHRRSVSERHRREERAGGGGGGRVPESQVREDIVAAGTRREGGGLVREVSGRGQDDGREDYQRGHELQGAGNREIVVRPIGVSAFFSILFYLLRFV